MSTPARRVLAVVLTTACETNAPSIVPPAMSFTTPRTSTPPGRTSMSTFGIVAPGAGSIQSRLGVARWRPGMKVGALAETRMRMGARPSSV